MRFILTLITCLFLSFTAIAVEKVTFEDINLTTKNHVLLRGTVDDSSISEVSAKLLKISANLPDDAIIYLVIDSGGGSVFAGIDLLNVMEIIPQKIHTVSLFAFSMAYTISQRGDVRYIVQRGIMGQHRAKGGFSGQFSKGEVEQKLNIMTKVIVDLETYEAGKLGITLDEFQTLIKDEMYVYYSDAVEKKVADKVAKIKCSKKLLQGRDVIKQCSMFGCVELKFSKCPLIRGILPDVKGKKVTEDDE